MRKFTKFIICCLFGVNAAQAQQSIGLQSGNFSTSYSAFLNPANTYSSKDRIYFNIYTPTMGYTTNAFNYNFPVNPFELNRGTYGQQNRNSYGGLNFSDNFLKLTNEDNNVGYFLNENFGPSLFARAGKNWGFGLGVKSVAGASFEGINKQTAQLLRYGSDTAGGAFNQANGLAQNQFYKNDAFGIDALSYQEWFFSLAYAAKDNNNSFWKVGATLKGIVANGYMGLHSSGIEYGVNSSNQLQLRNTNMNFAHTSDESALNVLQDPFGLNFSEANGGGAGIDIGFVYENRPNSQRKKLNGNSRINCGDEDDNEYNWKFGASITDLGFIAMNGQKSELAIDNSPASWNYNVNLINQKDYAQSAYDRLDRVDQGLLSQLGATQKAGFSVYTPAAFNANLDLKLKNNLYVAANLTQNLLAKDVRGLKRNSYLAITTRIETEHLEFGVPLILNQNYNRFNIGAYTRFGPVIIGSDNIPGLAKILGNDQHSSGNLYFGLNFKIKDCGGYTEQIVEDRRQPEIVKNDTTFWTDTIKRNDSIIIRRIDTVYKIKTVIDKVYDPVNSKTDSLKQVELKRKEDLLILRDKELRDREAAVTKRESQVGTGGGGINNSCCGELATVKNQKRTLEDEVERMRGQIRILQGENDGYRRKVTDLEADVNKYRKAAIDCEYKSSTSTAEIKRLKEEIIRYKISGSNPCESQTRSLDSLLIIEIDKRSKAEADLEKSKKDKTIAEEELIKNKSELDAADKKLKEYILRWGENGNCCENYSKTKKELDDLKKTATDASVDKKRIVELEAEIGNLKRKLNEEINKPKGSDCAIEKAKIIALEAEVGNLKRKLLEEQQKDVSNNCSVEKAKIVTLEAEIANLKRKLIENTGSGSNCDVEKKRITALEAELSSTKTKLTAEIAKSNTLQSKLDDCDKNSKAEAEVLKKAIDDKDKKIKSLEAEVTSLKSGGGTDSDCEVSLSQAKIEINNLKGQLASTTEEYNLMLADRNKYKDLYNSCQAELSKKSGSSQNTKLIDSLKLRISTLSAVVASHNSTIDGLKKSLSALQESYDKLLAEKNLLISQLNASKRELSVAKAERDALQIRLNECQGNGKESSPQGEIMQKGSIIGGLLNVLLDVAIESAKNKTETTPKVESTPSKYPSKSGPGDVKINTSDKPKVTVPVTKKEEIKVTTPSQTTPQESKPKVIATPTDGTKVGNNGDGTPAKVKVIEN